MAIQQKWALPIRVVASMPLTIMIVCKTQAPLHIGEAEFPVRCRLHRGKESITEMWRPEMY